MDGSRHQQTLASLLRQRELSRGQLLAYLAACGLGAVAGELLLDPAPQVGDAASPPFTSTKPDYLCLIVLDGFRPDYLGVAPTPAIDALSASGVFYQNAWVGQLESLTPTGHATITTGSLPRHDGIIGFEWRDPETRREVLDGWEAGSLLGQVGRDMQHAHDHSIPQAVKAANPSATIVSVSSEKVYAADAMSAGAADSVLYYRQDGQRLIPAVIPGSVPVAPVLSRPELSLPLPLTALTDWDTLSGSLALAAIGEIRPTVLLLNLPGSDYYGHKYGAMDSGHILARVVAGQDRQIGLIVQAYRDAGIFDRTLFVLTSDHGMVPNHHIVNPRAVTAAIKEAGAQHLFHTGGTSKYVYLTEATQNRAPAVAAALASVPNIAAAYFRTSSGDYELAGSPIDAKLDAAFRYFINTFSGSTAPDIIAPYRENTVGSAYAQLYGNHGGTSWKVQHIPLILSGPGVRRGVRSSAPARLVDVAPTILRLLGAPLPQADGIVLADALQAPTQNELATQVQLRPELAAQQDVIRAQSAEEIREDNAARLKHRPRLPVEP